MKVRGKTAIVLAAGALTLGGVLVYPGNALGLGGHRPAVYRLDADGPALISTSVAAAPQACLPKTDVDVNGTWTHFCGEGTFSVIPFDKTGSFTLDKVRDASYPLHQVFLENPADPYVTVCLESSTDYVLPASLQNFTKEVQVTDTTSACPSS